MGHQPAGGARGHRRAAYDFLQFFGQGSWRVRSAGNVGRHLLLRAARQKWQAPELRGPANRVIEDDQIVLRKPYLERAAVELDMFRRVAKLDLDAPGHGRPQA